MFRLTIRAHEKADVEAAISRLRAKSKAAGLGDSAVDVIARQMLATLNLLVERGQERSRTGSHMNVTRELSGDGYSVRLVFGAGGKESLLRKLLRFLKRY